MAPAAADLLTVIAPMSLQSWYPQFAGSCAATLFIGEDTKDLVEIRQLVAAEAGSRPIRILSGHDSLLRDWALAYELRAIGISTTSQSGMATAAGVDKVLQKRLLESSGIAVPVWGLDYAQLDPGRSLWKGRHSTQSRDPSWRLPGVESPPDSYWEKYVDGVEYSVVVYRTQAQSTIFPPVWKGRVKDDLSPPWRRLRVVPSGVSAQMAGELTATALKVANILDGWGFIEVEFIVPDGGPPHVTDVNPRICGTMRIVAMATGLAIFDPSTFPVGGGALLPVRYAAEIPYSGAPFATPRIVASSRLTCSGDSPRDVKRLLADQGFSVADSLWPGEWCDD